MANANLHSEQLAGKKASPSAQNYLDIFEIRDDTLVMKDGTLRSVILVSSMNFMLKSDDEQQAVIQGYMQFLNSFDFPLQIVIQSRKLRIDEYVDRLKMMGKEQTNELLRMQTQDYREFVEELVEIADIMSKRFYVVVPYSPNEKKGKKKQKTFFQRLGNVFSPESVITLREERFQKYREELAKRSGFIQESLQSLGLTTAKLDTQSLIELFYTTYNPDTAPQQDLVGLEQLRIDS